MLAYDDVLERLVATVESHVAMTALEEVVVVRDLHGRVRLVLHGSETPEHRSSLDQALKSALGAWHGGSPLSTSDPDAKSLAHVVRQKAEPWPPHWPADYDDDLGGRRPIVPGKWNHIQRVLAKESWLDTSPGAPPWPLHPKTPTVVTFYSFKGGVGRSTALGILAWRLAAPSPDGSPGKRVVAIDLDLEAPGLQGLFGVAADSVERGVLDWLLESAIAPGAQQVTGLSSFAKTVTVARRSVTVIPAGRTTGASYLEKLARLDYHATASAGASPVKAGLERLLEQVKSELNPDYILLDARAGFHDLGGLSLTSLAHINVVVARHAAATEPGLRLTLEMLGHRRAVRDQLLVVAQAFAAPAVPSEDPDPRDRRAFRELVQEILPTAATPVALEENPQIARAFALSDIPPAVLEAAAGYDLLLERLETLAEPTPSEASA